MKRYLKFSIKTVSSNTISLGEEVINPFSNKVTPKSYDKEDINLILLEGKL